MLISRRTRLFESRSAGCLVALFLFAVSVAHAQPNIRYDFDNDGKADVGRWHPTNSEFKVFHANTQTFSTYTLGSDTSKAAPGDFNGDGKTDAGVFQNGVWTYKTSPGASPAYIYLGTTGDIPAAGDYDGDGITDAAVFRPSTGDWWVKKSSNGATISYNFGMNGDIPVPGDFDGDGKTDYAVYRPGTSQGVWYIERSTQGFLAVNWGLPIDIPVQGDFDGGGKSDFAVFRPTDGSWYILTAENGSFQSAVWGNYADQPVPANYDGDNKTDIAIWRPTTGEWYIVNSYTNTVSIYQLGVPGDTAVESAYTKQIGGSVSGYALASERLKPINATGGTNLYSQNFSWGTSLVSLPGRSGLDLDLGIGYSSLNWIKVDGAMYFNPDSSNVSPGFRFGGPVIEPIYFDTPPDTKGKFAYIMVMPDGGRVQFRQSTASDTFYTADSSYTKLKTKGASNPNDPVEDISITVTTTDGTKMGFDWLLGAYRCTNITDRNGNYITYNYNANGLLTSVVDTLGRVVNINYDTGGYPLTITQTWKGNNGSGGDTTHTWATFYYVNQTVNTAFTIPTIGPPNGTSIKVLSKIKYSDDSTTRFQYNGYLQVHRVENWAADDHELNHVATDLASPASGQTDTPRFTQVRTYAESFNGGAEVTTNFTRSSVTNHPLGSQTISGTRIQSAVSGHPNGLITNTYYSSSGWSEGLPLGSEDCIGSCGGTNTKRWTWNSWTHDGPSNALIATNPRMTESQVGDGPNTKRTVIGYTPFGTYTLPTTVSVGDLSSFWKVSTTTYNTSTNYTNKWILTLPSQIELKGQNDELASLRSFYYDENGYTGAGQNVSATQHSSTYGTSYNYRGNLTRVARHDVSNTGLTINVSRIVYNINGSPIKQTDARDRETTISYNDNFNSSGNPSTYAYPTTITDPGGYSSTIQYRYDIGANVSVSGPNNLTTNRVFDVIGRLWQVSVSPGGAYTQYDYFANGRQFKTSSTITAGQGLAVSEFWTDGAGRTYRSRSELPNSMGGWSAVKTTYDKLGRVIEQSVPTEVSVPNPNDPDSWSPAGDDQSLSWRYNTMEYDWKGRVTRTLPAGAPSNGDTLYTYEGCGCSGGQITTIQGPVVPRDDQPGQTARRMSKSYEDILGRKFKSEAFNWSGSLYSTSIVHFNGRDQVIDATQTEASSSTSQVTTMDYDGHGRLTSRKLPQQTAPTLYNYNDDDTIQWTKDARLAMTTYTYGLPGQAEKRRLVTNITYSAPAGITLPGNVSFQYDNAGNRTQMNDGLGIQTYVYNALSQITSETRQFNQTLTDSPQPNNSFTIGYTYHMDGQLKSLTEPYGVTVNYDLDKIGRLTSVAPTASIGGVSVFASNAQYRAWGALKHLDFANGIAVDQTFDERMRPATYSAATSGTNVMQKSYDYYNDDSLRFVDDALNYKFDRLNTYDHMGRIKEAKSSNEANGGTVPDPVNDLPYRQTYTYNAFNDMTARTNKLWGNQLDLSYSITNGRISGWTYDEDGRAKETTYPDGPSLLKYDAAGRLEFKHDYPASTTSGDKFTSFHDGDGRELKRQTERCHVLYPDPPDPPPVNCDWTTDPVAPMFRVRSTVLGGEVIAEAKFNGSKIRRYVYASGSKIAELTQRYSFNPNQTHDAVQFYHSDAMGMSERVTRNSPETLLGDSTQYPNYTDPRHTETDPMGGNTGMISAYQPMTIPPNEPLGIENDSNFINGQVVNLYIDGLRMPHSAASNLASLLKSGTIHPLNTYSNNLGLSQAGISGHWVDRDDPAHWGGVITEFWLNGIQTQKEPTPLSGLDMDRWKVEAAKLYRLLSFVGDKGKTACRRYLEALGFDVVAIRESLTGQTPYDAFKSENDANEDFGQYGLSVREVHENYANQGKPFEGAATGSTGRVYYAGTGISVAVILHELLHVTNKGAGIRRLYDPTGTDPRRDPDTNVISFGPGSALISDRELQTRLGIGNQSDTRNITAELERNGCQ